MRHQKAGRKLGRSPEHRKSLLRNLMIELIEHRKIQTTAAKAKTVQPEIENLLALAPRIRHRRVRSRCRGWTASRRCDRYSRLRPSSMPAAMADLRVSPS